MDGDLGTYIQSVLSDPAQMAEIAKMAQGLMQGGEERSDATEQTTAPAPAPSPAAASAPEQGDMRLISTLGKLFSSGGGNSRSTALLVAMRPYMRPEKQEKLDRAMKLARMARIAGEVMREYGGGAHGI